MLSKEEAIAKVVTGEEVKSACLSKKIAKVKCRECSICHTALNYHVQGEDVFFDSSCDCTSSGGWQARTWEDAARIINIQTNPIIKVKFMEEFGFDVNQ